MRHILTTHIFPNTTSPIIVALSLAVGQIILLESTLSFVGLGIQPPTPSWGNRLNNAQVIISNAPALAFYPGALIFSLCCRSTSWALGCRVLLTLFRSKNRPQTAWNVHSQLCFG